jgi:hypothetical protein
MMRRRPVVVERRGPGLVGMVARTAVVAGTATMTSKAINNASANKQQQTATPDGQVQQGQAPVGQTPPASPAAPQSDVTAQLQQLAQMKQSGVLTDEEFQSAKAKILGS